MPTLPTRTQVLVIGAGPVGLALSCVLAGRGVEHLVVDPAPRQDHTSRAAVVHARTLEVLEEIGVAAALVERGVVVPRFTIRDRDRTLVEIDFAGLPTQYPFTLMVPQDETEQVLAERLDALGGAVADGWALETLRAGEGEAHATLVHTDGRHAEVLARHVVGADGMHSRTRTESGIAFEGSQYAQSFALADVHLNWALPHDEVQLFFSPAGLVVVAPLPHGRHRVVATLDQAPEHPDAHDIDRLLADRGPTGHHAEVREVVWSSRFRVHHRVAASYRRGPVFLAGDAAHVHSPAGGQGMNTGIQDAVALGALLADVLLGAAQPTVLDSYERLRRPVAQQVVALTDRITRAATLDGPPARLRNLALRAVGSIPPMRRALAMNLSELATVPAAQRTAAHAQ